MGSVPLKRMSCYRGSTTSALSPSVKRRRISCRSGEHAFDGTAFAIPRICGSLTSVGSILCRAYTRVHIVRDTSYNVAYWNLDHRDLTYIDGTYLVDGQPLHFFHFSGYSPNAPYLLSKHQGPRYPRILLSDHPFVARICDEYAVDLLGDGYGEEGTTDYAYKRLVNGLELDVPMRRLYRSALLAAERSGHPLPPNPLEAGQDDAFLDFLVGPSDLAQGSRLSRYLMAVHVARPDLQRAFPDPEGANFLGFATWVHHEVEAGRLDLRLAKLPVPPTATRFRLNTARQLERVGHQLEAVPVPGTGNEHVRINLAGYLQWLERWLTRLPVPQSGERARLNMTKALGRLERRAAAVPVPGTADDRVRLNVARVVGRLERRLTAVPDTTTPTGVATEEPVEARRSIAGYSRRWLPPHRIWHWAVGPLSCCDFGMCRHNNVYVPG